MPLRPVTLRAGCKINLFLHVGPKRPDGYHELDTLFLPLDEPHDLLHVSAPDGRPEGTLDVSFFRMAGGAAPGTPLPEIDTGHNTLTRAYAWFAERTGFAPPLSIRVDKGIPHGAGLGGGSADAAVLLRFLRGLARRDGLDPPSEDAFITGSATVGADVPFFLLSTPARAFGIGERLTPVPHPCAEHFLVLLCPDIRISTAWAFTALDAMRQKSPPAGLTSHPHEATTSLGRSTPGNDFEAVVFAAFPELLHLHEQLVSLGAETARLSGTGSSMFGLFREEKIAREAAKRLANDRLSVYMQHLLVG